MLKDIENIPEDNIKGNIFLRGERKKESNGTEDITPYSKVDELLYLIKDEKLKNKIKIGKVQLRGNVKDLLSYLLPNNTIEEKYGNITFGNATNTECSGEFWTGFNGGSNTNDEDKRKSVLPVEQFIELKKRSKYKTTYIRNAIIENLDSKSYSNEELENIHFQKDTLTNVNFKNCNLSKINMIGVHAGAGELKFEETILPNTMYQTTVGNFVLKKSTLLKREESQEGIDNFNIKAIFPTIKRTLKIYEITDNLFNQWTKEEIKNRSERHYQPPMKYIGPENMWKDKFELIYPNSQKTKTHFTNDDLTNQNDENINFSSLHKPQD